MPRDLLSPLTEMSTIDKNKKKHIFLECRVRLMREAENLTDICESIGLHV
jgi:hypothetical protein